MKKLTLLLIPFVLCSCANEPRKEIQRPVLPIFELTTKATNKEKYQAYRKSLNLMTIYSIQLEQEITRLEKEIKRLNWIIKGKQDEREREERRK